MSHLVSVILCAMFAFSSVSFGKTRQRQALKVNAERAMVIEGPISRGNIDHLADKLLEWDNSAPIDIVISSPGGDVVTGFNFVSVMKAAQSQGKTLRCFVPDVAASMAFQILVNCNERYVLNRSFLLWHRARIYIGGMFGMAMTSPLATHMGAQLGLLDDTIFGETNAALGVNEEWVRYHFENETLHTGSSLQAAAPNFVSSHDNIWGLMEVLRNDKVPRPMRQGFFDFDDLYVPGQIIYISPDLVRTLKY